MKKMSRYATMNISTSLSETIFHILHFLIKFHAEFQIYTKNKRPFARVYQKQTRWRLRPVVRLLPLL